MDIQYKDILLTFKCNTNILHTCISNTNILFKHGNLLQLYTSYMDIQYKYILKVWISNTKIFFKHGYSLQIYTSYMDIQYKYTL